MEFWGVEVKANETLKVTVDAIKLLHISQVALGELKNGKKVENIPVRVKMNKKKFVIGTLSSERAPQIMFDLVFEKDLELSHGWKDGSVYFCGYLAENHDERSPFDNWDSEEEEEEVAMTFNPNGKTEEKPKSSLKEAMDVDSEDDDSDDEDEDDSDEEDESEDEEEEEEKEPAKKIAAKPNKTPVPAAKKAKFNTPPSKSNSASPKTNGKKGGHTATPHPNSKPNFKKANKSGKKH